MTAPLSDTDERAVQLMVGRHVEKSADTAKKLRDFARDMQRMAEVFDERVATKKAAIERLTYILGDDLGLATAVYDYVIRGHLAYCNQLRERFQARRTGTRKD